MLDLVEGVAALEGEEEGGEGVEAEGVDEGLREGLGFGAGWGLGGIARGSFFFSAPGFDVDGLRGVGDDPEDGALGEGEVDEAEGGDEGGPGDGDGIEEPGDLDRAEYFGGGGIREGPEDELAAGVEGEGVVGCGSARGFDSHFSACGFGAASVGGGGGG